MAQRGRPRTSTVEEIRLRRQGGLEVFKKKYPGGVYTKNVHKKPSRQEQIFVDVYCSNGFKRLEACRIAYPKIKDVNQQCWNVLKRPKIKYLIDKKIEEEIMSKVTKTTDEILAELDKLLEETKKWGKEGGAVRKGTIELFMKHAGMLIEKRETIEKSYPDWLKEQEAKKAEGSDLKIVEMPKDE